MGSRLLREWLCRPLRDRTAILRRQDAVAAFVDERVMAGALGEVLSTVQDVPRIVGRLGLARATPRDLVALAKSVRAGVAARDALDACVPLASWRTSLSDAVTLALPTAERILTLCVDAPPNHLREGGLIRDGVDPDLDEARLLQRDAGAWLSAYQADLIKRFNLPSLKVGFNRVFGYFIELPAAQARTAPAELQRTQTLRGSERFTTPELRTFESKVTTAEARALERERTLFAELSAQAAADLQPLAILGATLAELDALLGLADKAHARQWVRPDIVDAPVLRLHGARHPVLDEVLQGQFVPNDVELGDESTPAARLALITGPNMAGKSTYIRTAALLTLLAHVGSFVPADRATVGITDRIFTRIGADDALHSGQSTFMVEMVETANILHHATPRSLVILDEIGRGTSTLDGLSLAWAIAEHIACPPAAAAASAPSSDASTSDAPPPPPPPPTHGPRALFATHYHELTDLEDRFPQSCRNLHVLVREWPPGDPNAQIVFLHRIEPGRTDQSYGVHVARLAGLPHSVIARAREVLGSLAVHHHVDAPAPAPAAASGTSATSTSPRKPRRASVGLDPHAIPAPRQREPAQLPLFTEYLPHPALDSLRELRLDHMTPIQAFDALRSLRGLLSDSPPP
jgi:DNA mismatch repair protein MutS